MERGCDAMDHAPWGSLAVRSPDRSLAIRSWIRTKWLVLDECMKHILCATSEWADAGGRGVGGSGGSGGRGGAWAIDRRATPALCDGDGRALGRGAGAGRHRAGVRGIVRLEDTGVDVLDAADFVFYEPPAADAAPIDGM